ncbi:MAG: hypothetical protein HQL54_03335 [Magnetococcales bacterium]|nr:hypothetical protein [Magnetococcales bacterium]
MSTNQDPVQRSVSAPTHALFPIELLRDKRFHRRPRSILVLLAFCSRSDEMDEELNPSVRTISELTGFDIGDVEITVKILEDAGWLIHSGSVTSEGVKIYEVSDEIPNFSTPARAHARSINNNILYLRRKEIIIHPPPPKQQTPCEVLTELILPEDLATEQLSGVAKLLSQLEGEELRQSVLDELAGAMEGGRIKRPIRYLEAIVSKAFKGEFIPEYGVEVARKRRAVIEAEKHRKRLEELELSKEPKMTIEQVMEENKRTMDPALALILNNIGRRMLDQVTEEVEAGEGQSDTDE